ncbi:MAG: hypothetical protein NXI09_08145 [Bacteroidetes bacterium]|nr:hypothetical protein [Bacteroidota bacterium]
MIFFSFPPWDPGFMVAILNPGFLFSYAIFFSAAVYGVRHFKKLAPAYRVLVLLLVTVTISETMSRIIAYQYNSTVPVYHFLIPFQIVFHSLIFKNLFIAKSASRLFLILGGIVLMLSIAISINDGLFVFPSFNITWLSFYLILGTLYLFFQLVQNPSDKSLFSLAEFWFAMGTLFFYAGTFLIYGLYDYFTIDGRRLPSWVSKVTLTLNWILYLSYFISIYLERIKAPSKHESH